MQIFMGYVSLPEGTQDAIVTTRIVTCLVCGIPQPKPLFAIVTGGP